MESYLNEFDVKSKGSSEEALERWRKLCGIVKNPRRRFRFTANISKRYEAAAMRRSNQVLVIPLILSLLTSLCSIHTCFPFRSSTQNFNRVKIKFWGS